MGLFKKLLGSKESAFQKQVLSTIQSEIVKASPDPLHVTVAGTDLDLSPLYKTCSANQVQAADFIRQYFSFPLAFAFHEERSWNQIESFVRPQLVPATLARPFNLLLFPFADPIATCVVIQEADRQMFIRSSDLQKWNVVPEELLNRSVLNLDSEKVETEVTITDGTDRFIGLESHDGFDAARILLPRVRDLAAGKLGIPYFAGFPNRDFLILWSKECSARFQDYAIEKIQTDYSIQSYPLTPIRFEVDKQSIHPL
jgi:hypothetical protein